MKFTLEIKCDGDAFVDRETAQPDPCHEVAMLLVAVADKVRQAPVDGSLMDVNGNTVGSFKWSDE